jgi:FtsP/CotA-like multicopper oxidase with cupredoxin domain
MATRNVTISGPAGQATFDPDDLAADRADNVCWGNETNDTHQIAVNGVAVTDPIRPWDSSTQYSVPSSVTYTCLLHANETGKITVSALIVALCLSFFAAPARAQHIPCTELLNKELVNPPEIARGDDNVLRGALVTIGQKERIASVLKAAGRKAGPINPADLQCDEQWVRSYIIGKEPLPSQRPEAPITEPMPGPTLRARVGDLVELTFLNMIERLRFGNADKGKCDQVDMGKLYPGTGPLADTFPDCFNESIITNVHYHGTHTNPNSTGDNVFLQIMPSPRSNDAARRPVVTMASVQAPFADFFNRCEARLVPYDAPVQWPMVYSDLPQPLRTTQDDLLITYAPDWYRQNQQAILRSAFPQNYVGAFPYCFRLPAYTASAPPSAMSADAHSAHSAGAGSAEAPAPPPPLQMGQLPGTHWYHAHKHGSTTINVSNGMTGVFIIEGAYDDEIKKNYPNGIKQQVILLNQLQVLPLLEVNAAKSATAVGGGPYFSVNGRLQPYIKMRPGEVQWWRIANSSSRSGAYFLAPTSGLQWKQLAQDGVQFTPENFRADWNDNAPFLLASGNRADLLVRAPAKRDTYSVLVYNTVDPADRTPAAKPVPLTLLTVKVDGADANMDFPLKEPPVKPPFLNDIEAKEVQATRVLTFSTNVPPTKPPMPPKPSTPPGGPGLHRIDGKQFDGEVGAVVLLNQVEEWKIVNETYGTPTSSIAHPFHIHINPFQVVEVFEPNATITIADPNNPGKTTILPQYIFDKNSRKSEKQCYLDPNVESTWKPCDQVQRPPNIWWDVFPIPSGVIPVTKNAKGESVRVPGYFKMRSRFVDFSGYYVLHCHILAHEDRGMMTVVYVAPLQPPFSHH